MKKSSLIVREYPDAYLCLGIITDLPLVVDRVEMRLCLVLVVDRMIPSWSMWGYQRVKGVAYHSHC